jgi:hypothetical protein
LHFFTLGRDAPPPGETQCNSFSGRWPSAPRCSSRPAAPGISIVAGSTTATSNADGPATATTLTSPTRLRLASGGLLYLSDRSQGGNGSRPRRIHLSGGTIETYIAGGASQALGGSTQACPTSVPIIFATCSGDPGCSMAQAPAPDGRIYIAATFCGTSVGSSGGSGSIVRVENDNSFTPIVFNLDVFPALAFDSGGNLWVAKLGNAPHLGYYSAANLASGPPYIFNPVAQGTVGAEYTANTGFSSPNDLTFTPAHGWFVDTGVSAIRVMW